MLRVAVGGPLIANLEATLQYVDLLYIYLYVCMTFMAKNDASQSIILMIGHTSRMRWYHQAMWGFVGVLWELPREHAFIIFEVWYQCDANINAPFRVTMHEWNRRCCTCRIVVTHSQHVHLCNCEQLYLRQWMHALYINLQSSCHVIIAKTINVHKYFHTPQWL